MEILCPICGKQLDRRPDRWVCLEGHSFDVARQGYVNLLPVDRKRSLHPGDTRQQVLSRREFLEGGFYAPIARTLIETARELGISGELLDVGCGEGYYCTRLSQALGMELTGLDISKEAVRWAAGKYKGPTWLCASAARIPAGGGSVDLLTSLFALTQPEEYRRVLKENGFFFQVLAAQDHLMGLKSIIYDHIDLKQKDTVPTLAGFQRVKSIPIRFSFTVEGAQVENLLAMTPHVYRIGKAGAERLRNTTRLTDSASCMLNVFRRT